MKLHVILGALAGATLFATGALALPAATGKHAPAPQSGLVTEVAQGCGPGGYRVRGGRCAYRRPAPAYHHRHYAPRRHYHRHRHCFIRHTPAGPRRICR